MPVRPMIHDVFIPKAHRDDSHRPLIANHSLGHNGTQAAPDGPQSFLTISLPDAQHHLAPTLLLLYGDVSKTGYRDKEINRHYISTVLRYLWQEQSHRPAFRKIVTEPSGTGGTHFQGFASGVLEEVNSQFVSLQQFLSTINEITALKATAEWAAMTEEMRKGNEDKLREAEGHIKLEGKVVLELLLMMNNLSSDTIIRKGFLATEVLDKFTSALLSVILNMTGSMRAQFEQTDSRMLGYDPFQFLVQVCEIIAHVANADTFRDAVIANGYYNEGKPLDSAVDLFSRQGQATEAKKIALRDFVQRVRSKANSAETRILQELLAQAPDDYRDPITEEIMKDPVRLPKGKQVVDRSTLDSSGWKGE